MPQTLPPTLPLRDFFRNPERSIYRISPDGNYIAHLEPFERRMNIFVAPRDNPSDQRRITDVTDRDIGSYWWKDSDRILYTRDFGGDENFHLFVTTLDGAPAIDLTPFHSVRAEVLDLLDDVPNEVLILSNHRDPVCFDVYRLNIKSGELTLVAENPGDVAGWIADFNGVVRMAVRSDGVNHRLLHRPTADAPFEEVFATNFREQLVPIRFTFDNKDLICTSNVGRDKAAAIRFDLTKKQEVELLYERDDVDIDNIVVSKASKKIIAFLYTTWKSDHHVVDERTKQLLGDLEQQLPDIEVAISSMTRDEQFWIVRTHSDRSLGAFYLYDTEARTLKILGELQPALKPADLAEMKPIEYRSRDGLTIHGYLTLPNGRDPKGLPLIVNPHGGPWVRDQWHYDPEVQFLANRGYAVLQPNYRGSTGYGKAFWEASFKQWGRAMQDDITDGVKHLVNLGIVDPKRVAIYGGSYGGYATLAGLAFTPEVYACGVDYVGVSNLLSFMTTIPPYWEPYREMMYEMVGNLDTEQEDLRQRSPLFSADRIVAPLLVIQGAKDPRVNLNESNQIVAALRNRGVAVEYIVNENEGHGFRNEENRFEVYEAMERFFTQHLPATL